jgi:hypothetical protein
MREVNAVNTERAALKARSVADGVRDEVVSAYRRIGKVGDVAVTTCIGYGLVQRILPAEGFVHSQSTVGKE